MITVGATVYELYSPFGSGVGTIFLDEVQCSGQEFRLFDCDYKDQFEHNCFHYEDVGIHCNPHGKNTLHTCNLTILSPAKQ